MTTSVGLAIMSLRRCTASMIARSQPKNPVPNVVRRRSNRLSKRLHLPAILFGLAA